MYTGNFTVRSFSFSYIYSISLNTSAPFQLLLLLSYSPNLEYNSECPRLRRDLVSHVAFNSLSILSWRKAHAVFHKQDCGHETNLCKRQVLAHAYPAACMFRQRLVCSWLGGGKCCRALLTLLSSKQWES